MKTENSTHGLKEGIYVKGIAISSTATAFPKKDKSGNTVKVTHEFALRPGTVKWDQFFDPKDEEVTLENGEVTDFPRLEEFKLYLLRVTKVKEYYGVISLQHAEIMPEEA